MDLQRVVRRRPGDAGAEQLGLAGLEVAALAFVLGARGEISESGGRYGPRPPSSRSCRRRAGNGPAPCRTGCAPWRSAAPAPWRDCATPTARAAVWMRAPSNVCINCLKPWPSTPPSRFSAGTSKSVEGDFIFLHAAIAEHFDLAAGHALGREGVGVVAARLFRQQHGQALVAGLVGIGAGQKRHQVGADRMGDPGLVAVDDIFVALPHGARAQRGEVGAGVRLGEDGGRQDFARRDLRQIFFLLRLACRRTGSVRRRFPTVCRASRRRYRRAKAPR